MEQNSLNRSKVDWSKLRRNAIGKLDSINKIEETYPIIQSALNELGDKHSFLLTPERKKIAYNQENKLPEIKNKLIDNKIGYIKIPEFIGNDSLTLLFAKKIQRKIKELNHNSNTLKWIVDLRDNRGGNMWPMFLGIAPILKNGTAGYFVDSNNNYSKWNYSEGSVSIDDEKMLSIKNYYEIKDQNFEIAVLIGNKTSSSGEAIATIFKGLPNAKFFGQETFGLTTGNDLFELSDGAILVLTISKFADRHKNIVLGKIKPDFYSNSPKTAAIKWLTNHTQYNNGSSPISGTVRKKIINLTNKQILSRQIRVPYSANWR